MREESCLILISLCAVVVFFCPAYTMADTWRTLDFPGASETYIYGIDGSNLVGCYKDATSNYHGFLYNRSSKNWTTLDNPGASYTYAFCIKGDKIGGNGFLYNMTSGIWTYPLYSGSYGTGTHGISGDKFVGEFSYDGNRKHGFIYDGTNWTKLDFPGARSSYAWGIDENNIVGVYQKTEQLPIFRSFHGYLYNGSTWTALDYPGTQGTIAMGGTFAYGVDGNNIVGFYGVGTAGNSGNHGFRYDMASQEWIALDFPGASGTAIYGIDGINLVGEYVNSSGCHGFLYTIPEPATILLLGLGSLALLRKRRA